MHYGPQPYAAYVSVICEEFGCTPQEAEQQDPNLVHAIFEYRTAKAAIQLFNSGRKGVAAMQASPALQELLLELHRAQTGTMLSDSDLLTDMEGRGDDG